MTQTAQEIADDIHNHARAFVNDMPRSPNASFEAVVMESSLLMNALGDKFQAVARDERQPTTVGLNFHSSDRINATLQTKGDALDELSSTVNDPQTSEYLKSMSQTFDSVKPLVIAHFPSLRI